MTRAARSLWSGEVRESLDYNPLLLPTLVVLGASIVKRGELFVIWAGRFLVVALFCFTVIRNHCTEHSCRSAAPNDPNTFHLMPRIAIHTVNDTSGQPRVFHDNNECSFVKGMPSSAAILPENVRIGRDGRQRCVDCEKLNEEDKKRGVD